MLKAKSTNLKHTTKTSDFTTKLKTYFTTKMEQTEKGTNCLRQRFSLALAVLKPNSTQTTLGNLQETI